MKTHDPQEKSAEGAGADSGRDTDRIIVFAVDQLRCALILSAVERVLQAVEVTPLPHAPAVVYGAINWQGQILPVVDIRKRLLLPTRKITSGDHFIIARTSNRFLALIVDSVIGIREIAREQTEYARQSLPFVEYLRGVAKMEDDIVLIYDLDAFVSLEEERQLADALAEDIP